MIRPQTPPNPGRPQLREHYLRWPGPAPAALPRGSCGGTGTDPSLHKWRLCGILPARVPDTVRQRGTLGQAHTLCSVHSCFPHPNTSLCGDLAQIGTKAALRPLSSEQSPPKSPSPALGAHTHSGIHQNFASHSEVTLCLSPCRHLRSLSDLCHGWGSLVSLYTVPSSALTWNPKPQWDP